MLSFLPEDHPASTVVEKLSDAGFRSLLAGGAVRDRLLGRPASDFDVATSAEPSEVKQVFEHVVPVGEDFGVVLVVLDGQAVEVATFRSDAEYEDGRHPVGVSFSLDPEEDAARRDFLAAARELVYQVADRYGVDGCFVAYDGLPFERAGTIIDLEGWWTKDGQKITDVDGDLTGNGGNAAPAAEQFQFYPALGFDRMCNIPARRGTGRR